MKVAFCGHRMVSETETVRAKLRAIIEQLIEEGATEFLLGGYGEFDYLCAHVVYDLKEKYPEIRSILVVPYLNRYQGPNLYDESEYPPIEKTPKRYAILKRNEYMVEKSDVVVSYVQYGFGGAAKTRDYAVRKKKRIIEVL